MEHLAEMTRSPTMLMEVMTNSRGTWETDPQSLTWKVKQGVLTTLQRESTDGEQSVRMA